MSLLVLRIAEVLACDVEYFTHQRGYRVLPIVRKTEPPAPIVLHALETYVTERSRVRSSSTPTPLAA